MPLHPPRPVVKDALNVSSLAGRTDSALVWLLEGFWKVLSNDVTTLGANIRLGPVSRKKRPPDSGSAVSRDLTTIVGNRN
jgi:hypothetical protein